jgi:hypothetical protein
MLAVSLYSVGEGEFTLKFELTNSVGGDYLMFKKPQLIWPI